MNGRTITRGVALAAALAAAGSGAVGVAGAGQATTDASGNFAVLDVDVSPPQAGTKAKPRGVSIAVHGFYGNSRSGARSPFNGDTTILVPRGMRMNGALFPVKCPLPATSDDLGKESRCPAKSKVGAGTAELDARPAIQDFVPATLNAYNGALKDGHATLLVIFTATVGNTAVHGELDLEYLNQPSGVYGHKLVTFHQVQDSSQGFFSVRKLDVAIPNQFTKLTIKGKRTKVYLVEPPTKCKRTWAFAQTTTTLAGDASITATDAVPCTKAPPR